MLFRQSVILYAIWGRHVELGRLTPLRPMNLCPRRRCHQVPNSLECPNLSFHKSDHHPQEGDLKAPTWVPQARKWSRSELSSFHLSSQKHLHHPSNMSKLKYVLPERRLWSPYTSQRSQPHSFDSSQCLCWRTHKSLVLHSWTCLCMDLKHPFCSTLWSSSLWVTRGWGGRKSLNLKSQHVPSKYQKGGHHRLNKHQMSPCYRTQNVITHMFPNYTGHELHTDSRWESICKIRVPLQRQGEHLLKFRKERHMWVFQDLNSPSVCKKLHERIVSEEFV